MAPSIITQWQIDEAARLGWVPLMIALLLAVATDPLLVQLKEVGAPPIPTCPIDVVLQVSGEDTEEVQRLRIDPGTEEVTLLDENGDPVEPEETSEDTEEETPDEAEEGSVSVGNTNYSDVLEKLDLEFQRMGPTPEGVLFRAERLPEGTIDLGSIDLSKRSALELTVAEGANGPFVSRYRTELMKPMRVKLVARVSEFTQNVQFAEIDGYPRNLRQELTASMSVFGNNQNVAMAMDFSYPPCDAAVAD